jgi:hypothetical protein
MDFFEDFLAVVVVAVVSSVVVVSDFLVLGMLKTPFI